MSPPSAFSVVLSLRRVDMRTSAAAPRDARTCTRTFVHRASNARRPRARAPSASTTRGGFQADERVDVVVVGAGVIGLACARELSRRGMRVFVADRAPAVGLGTSARNSEVLHAGMHYAPGSLKADFCVRGRRMIVDYCEKKDVRWDNIGKIIVASEESQMDDLEAMIERAMRNDVDDLELLSAESLREYEKNVRGFAGVWSPSTSVVDTRELMESFRRDCVRDGRTSISLGDEVVEITPAGRAMYRVKTKSKVIAAPRIVNAAGLHAHRVCERMTEVYDQIATPPPPLYFARGLYCTLKKGAGAPFQRLVYPLPRHGGLGVHFTKDVFGNCKFGPDIEWIDEIDYTIKPERVSAFYDAIREYWPELPDGFLRTAYTGIRPKLINETGDEDEPGATTDFMIQTEVDHRASGVVHLFGFESPGLTSAMCVAERVCELLE